MWVWNKKKDYLGKDFVKSVCLNIEIQYFCFPLMREQNKFLLSRSFSIRRRRNRKTRSRHKP